LPKYCRRLLAVLLLGAVLLAGCENIGPKPAELTSKSDPGRAAQTKPDKPTGQPEAKPAPGQAVSTVREGEKPSADPAAQVAKPAKEATVTAGQPKPQLEPGAGTAPAKVSPAGQEKPLVIVSQNPVFAGTGQLLVEIDKELELFLGSLEAMDDIQAEELNF